MKRRFTGVSAFFLALWLLLVAFFSVALNHEIYYYAQRRAGVTAQNSGLTAEECLTLDRQTAMFLAGRGSVPDGLSEDGQTHMRDVKALFSFARGAMIASFVLGIVFFLLGGCRLKPLRRAYRVFVLALAVLSLAVSLLGTERFERLFSAFHRAVFSNGYWLMNPETEMLIRVMPIDFFKNMALYTFIAAGIFWLIGGLILAAIQRWRAADEK